MALDQILAVAALAAGDSVTVAHALADGVGRVKPNFINPDRPTPIGVAAATTTSVTFTNHGNVTESAFFHVKRDHSLQQAGDVELFWQGFTGFNSFALATPQYNDLLTPLVSISSFGANPPRMVKQADDGTVVPGFALSFNGTNAVASLPDFGDFTNSYSLSFWLNSAYGANPSRNILSKNATINITMQAGSLRVQLSGMAQQIVPGFNLGAKNHIVVVVTKVAAAVTRLEIYVNGTIRLTTSFPNALAVDNANTWAVMATNHAGTMDEIRLYQAALTAAQVTELYNAAAGTEAEPTGSPTLLAGYHCNEGAGVTIDNYEGTAARDGTLTNVAWVAGLVGAAGTPGVFAWEFMPDEDMDLQFSLQMSHAWKYDTDYDLHVHWTAPDLAAGDVVIGVELQRANIHDPWPANTTVYTTTFSPQTDQPIANYHGLKSIVTLPGTLFRLSHIVRGRVFRKGTDGADTFPLPLVLDNIDCHHQVDTLGSRSIVVK